MDEKLNSICNDLENILKGLENKIQLIIDTRSLIKISKDNENKNIIMNNLFKIEDQLREMCGILNKTLLYHNKEKIEINLKNKDNLNLINKTYNSDNNFNNIDINSDNNLKLDFNLSQKKEKNNDIKNIEIIQNKENINNDINKKEEYNQKNNNINNVSNQTNIINSTNNNNFPITINNIQIYDSKPIISNSINKESDNQKILTENSKKYKNKFKNIIDDNFKLKENKVKNNSFYSLSSKNNNNNRNNNNNNNNDNNNNFVIFKRQKTPKLNFNYDNSESELKTISHIEKKTKLKKEAKKISLINLDSLSNRKKKVNKNFNSNKIKINNDKDCYNNLINSNSSPNTFSSNNKNFLYNNINILNNSDIKTENILNNESKKIDVINDKKIEYNKNTFNSNKSNLISNDKKENSNISINNLIITNQSDNNNNNINPIDAATKIKEKAEKITNLIFLIQEREDLLEILSNLYETNILEELLNYDIDDDTINQIYSTIEEIEKLKLKDMEESSLFNNNI